MMDSYREGKLRAQAEEERNQGRQRIATLECELREQSGLRTKLEEVQKVLRSEIDEQTKTIKELKETCQRGAEKAVDLRREIEHEKQLTEEWKVRCVKSEGQKSMSDQVEVRLSA